MCKNINGDSYIIVDWGILCIEAEFRDFVTKYPSETSFIKIFNQQKRKFEKMAWGKKDKNRSTAINAPEEKRPPPQSTCQTLG